MDRYCSYCCLDISIDNGDHWYIWNNKYQCKLRRSKNKQQWHQDNKEEENKKSSKRYSNNRDDELSKMRAWYEENKDARASSMKVWRHNNKSKLRDYYRDKRATDINFKLACNLRTRLWHALKKNQKTGSAVSDLGCSIEELRAYLEAQFQDGMSWDNYGHSSDCWNIDHIKPMAKFDLTDPEQLKEACHYTNLQPLWASENYSKKDS